MSKHAIRVLLVEDDEEDYIITKELLIDVLTTKYQIEWAPSFEEGLELIEQNNYDVYLVDFRLGKEEGLALINQISPQKRKTPFILLTGQGDMVLDQKAMEAGASDFLDKTNLSAALLDRAIRYSIQQKKNIQELKDRKEKLKEAQALAHIGSFEWIIETNLITWSDELFRIFGYSPQSFQVTRKKFGERIHPDDQTMVQKKVDWIIKEKKPLDFNYRIVCPNRGIRYLEGTRKIELDSNGNLISIFGSIQDVTNRTLQEKILQKEKEKAQTYLDMAGSIILILDQDEKVQMVNQEGIHILGYEEAEIVGENWFNKFIPNDSRDKTRKIFNDLILRKQENVEHYENQILTKNGTTRMIQWYNRLVLDEQGIPLATISSGIDVTERKKAEQDLKNLNLTLEKKVAERTQELLESENKLKDALKKEQDLGELKSRFVAMASHEFRTPLTAIYSSADLIGRYQEKEQQPKRDKHLKRITSAVKNLTGILNDFLSLEKLESNKVRYEPRSITLDEFLDEILEDLKLITKQNQSIQIEKTGTLVIQTDPHLLKNILFNLLSNAIKYSPAGKEIGLIFENENNLLTIQVKDQGIGIPEEDQKHMFSRFFRASNATAIKGTGLGLTIVKRYLGLMGGDITFTSIPNEGTTFKLTIPQ